MFIPNQTTGQAKVRTSTETQQLWYSPSLDETSFRELFGSFEALVCWGVAFWAQFLGMVSSPHTSPTSPSPKPLKLGSSEPETCAEGIPSQVEVFGLHFEEWGPPPGRVL